MGDGGKAAGDDGYATAAAKMAAAVFAPGVPRCAPGLYGDGMVAMCCWGVAAWKAAPGLPDLRRRRRRRDGRGGGGGSGAAGHDGARRAASPRIASREAAGHRRRRTRGSPPAISRVRKSGGSDGLLYTRTKLSLHSP
ncbi:Os01g0824666 [Oryza sativa Japonica Group]|uniref:Os01g0824666 protein n=1 Tax=Oryza sativa subsp. japonica TaxID=39947 RepID=A0A0P0V9T9_ORYSJ|nr:Os01g0824666 [Oryza sativa Japonica Group]